MFKLYFDIYWNTILNLWPYLKRILNIKDIGFIIIANTSGNYRHSFE